MRILEGITVLSLEQAVAAPFCCRQLADLGARVIKIERPDTGDFARGYDNRVKGMSSYFVWANRSKESLTLNIKAPRAKAILDQLLEQSDVLVQNLAPGATQRLGLGYESIKDSYPELIVCDITGYGEDGPYSNKKAYDLLIQAESGFVSVTGGPADPAKSAASIADIAAGMYAYSNILAALIQRGKTDRGCRIEVSMLEALLEWNSYPLYYSHAGAAPPPRTGADHASIYPYGCFAAGDGNMLMLGLQNEREWKVFCEQVLQRPELARDPRFATNKQRSENRYVLRGLIEAVLAEFSLEEAGRRLDRAGIANARVNDMHAVWEHAQLKGRNRWTEVASPNGAVPALLPPGLPTGCEPRMDPIPALGEHTDAILAELGYGKQAIADLHQAGVV